MTRVLVLGTSHAACLRDAFPEIRKTAPQCSLDFWGLPGGAFHKARIGDDGLLRPDPTDRIGVKKVATWNDKAAIDLAPYDRIFLVGLRLGLYDMLKMMVALQPLDWGRRNGALGVSERFLRAAFEAEVGAGLSAQALRTPLDARFTFMTAPYPARLATAPDGPREEPVLRKAAELERASDLLDMVEESLHSVLAARGVGFVAQPRDTLASPFLTRDSFLHAAEKDARHMNTDYGQIALQALLASSTTEFPSAKAAQPARRA